ncbi:sensor histidine kinase [filamentous cyanobacterium CCP5]|nr:sensor histidine kinase [filamentous cyanobacterium CCP5]
MASAPAFPPNSSPRRFWDANSLQTRLTVGVVLAALLGLGGVTGWMAWRMRQILLESHTEKAETIAQRFEEDVSLYQEMMPTPEALQQVVDYRTTPDTALWIQSPDDQLLAASETLSIGSWQTSGLSAELLDLNADNLLAIRSIQDWTLVICVSPLIIDGQMVGTLFIADDITANQASFQRMTLSLVAVTAVVVTLLAIAIAYYVQRSLRPLRQLNRLASTVTAETLCAHQLQLEAAPTEVQELAASYNLMLERLSRAWAQQKSFVNNFSHELRTPLTLVQGYLQSTLRRCHTLTDPQREGLEIATTEAERTIRMLQELLNLARIDSGQMTFNLQPTQLKEVVMGAADQADPGGDRIRVEICSAPTVNCDRSRLHEALSELLDNAIKYAQGERPIQMRLDQSGEWAIIEIQDHGRGIPWHQQADIFEPFYRVDEDRARTTGGTGLGLTLVRAFVEGMRGQIALRSIPEQGTTFTISLPV